MIEIVAFESRQSQKMNSKAAAQARKTFRAFCLILQMHVICTNAWMVDNMMAASPGNPLHSNQGRTSLSSVLPIASRLHFRRNCTPRCVGRPCSTMVHASTSETSSTEEGNNSCILKMSQLNDMDVVIYSLLDDDDDDDKLCLGAVQENGVISALSAWTDELAFGNSVEFLVDEVDRFSLAQQTEEQRKADGEDDGNNDKGSSNNTIRIHHVLSEDEVSYGARQCPRGVHNPHGEESELLYYVDQDLMDRFEVRMELKPELETLW